MDIHDLERQAKSKVVRMTHAQTIALQLSPEVAKISDLLPWQIRHDYESSNQKTDDERYDFF